MTWNTNERNTDNKIFINGEEHNVGNLEGQMLADEIMRLASEYDISKFDIFDASQNRVDEDDVIDGDFEFPLRLVRINHAA